MIIEASIDPRGRILDAPSSGVPVFDQAAFEAVRQWDYMPTLLNGNPIPIIMTVTVRFRLKATS